MMFSSKDLMETYSITVLKTEVEGLCHVANSEGQGTVSGWINAWYYKSTPLCIELGENAKYAVYQMVNGHE